MRTYGVAAHLFDPFEYLMLRHKDGLLKTDFPKPLGKVTYHALATSACRTSARKPGSFSPLFRKPR